MCAVNSLISVCLRRAGETHPDTIPSEEIHENKLSQLMKNKTVHLLAVFLVVYTGIEATIGGIIRSIR
jgi:fucose permease